ncbi:MAG: hypothetical protein M1308_00745, partial [Actinobacteria bacterium]|nr:hypothetical protein [Actinomycetota bacterium]
MLTFAIFLLFPMVYAFLISLYDYSGIGPLKDFTGLENFRNTLMDTDILNAILNTFKLLLCDMFISMSAAFLLAYIIYRRVHGWRFFSVALLVPFIAPLAV